VPSDDRADAVDASPVSKQRTARSPRRRRPKGEHTETLFRDAARVVFARDGYLKSRIEDIAAEAGRSPGSFYNYFDSKEDLLAVLAEDFHTHNRAALAVLRKSGVPADEFLRGAIATWISNYRAHIAEMAGVFQASMVEDDFRQLWSSIRAEAIGMIAGGVTRAQSEGKCPGLDPLLAASALSSMLEHFCYVWFHQGGDRIGVEFDERRAVDTLAALWYHAVYWDPA
jgi:AcrR family transcriptional regulator